MKQLSVTLLIISLFSIFGLSACAQQSSTVKPEESLTPPANIFQPAPSVNAGVAPGINGSGAEPGQTLVEISSDEVLNQKHISRQVSFGKYFDLDVVILSNPSAGLSWDVNPVINDPTIVQLKSNVPSKTPATEEGAGTTSIVNSWVFTGLKQGETKINFDSQPWSGGEKGMWSVELTAIVDNPPIEEINVSLGGEFSLLLPPTYRVVSFDSDVLVNKSEGAPDPNKPSLYAFKFQAIQATSSKPAIILFHWPQAYGHSEGYKEYHILVNPVPEANATSGHVNLFLSNLDKE